MPQDCRTFVYDAEVVFWFLQSGVQTLEKETCIEICSFKHRCLTETMALGLFQTLYKIYFSK